MNVYAIIIIIIIISSSSSSICVLNRNDKITLYIIVRLKLMFKRITNSSITSNYKHIVNSDDKNKRELSFLFK